MRDEAGIDRDRLVEMGIRLAQAAFKRQVRRRILPHQDILADLDVLYEEAKNVLKKLSGHEMRRDERNPLCDYRDPVERGLEEILYLFIEMRDAIGEELESGEPMGEYREFP